MEVILRQGSLEKWTNFVYRWQPRHVVLARIEKNEIVLRYTTSQSSDVVLGSHTIKAALVLLDRNSQNAFDVVLADGSRLHFRAKDSNERHQWTQDIIMQAASSINPSTVAQDALSLPTKGVQQQDNDEEWQVVKEQQNAAGKAASSTFSFTAISNANHRNAAFFITCFEHATATGELVRTICTSFTAVEFLKRHYKLMELCSPAHVDGVIQKSLPLVQKMEDLKDKLKRIIPFSKVDMSDILRQLSSSYFNTLIDVGLGTLVLEVYFHDQESHSQAVVSLDEFHHSTLSDKLKRLGSEHERLLGQLTEATFDREHLFDQILSLTITIQEAEKEQLDCSLKEADTSLNNLGHEMYSLNLSVPFTFGRPLDPSEQIGLEPEALLRIARYNSVIRQKAAIHSNHAASQKDRLQWLLHISEECEYSSLQTLKEMFRQSRDQQQKTRIDELYVLQALSLMHMNSASKELDDRLSLLSSVQIEEVQRLATEVQLKDDDFHRLSLELFALKRKRLNDEKKFFSSQTTTGPNKERLTAIFQSLSRLASREHSHNEAFKARRDQRVEKLSALKKALKRETEKAEKDAWRRSLPESPPVRASPPAPKKLPIHKRIDAVGDKDGRKRAALRIKENTAIDLLPPPFDISEFQRQEDQRQRDGIAEATLRANQRARAFKTKSAFGEQQEQKRPASGKKASTSPRIAKSTSRSLHGDSHKLSDFSDGADLPPPPLFMIGEPDLPSCHAHELSDTEDDLAFLLPPPPEFLREEQSCIPSPLGGDDQTLDALTRISSPPSLLSLPPLPPPPPPPPPPPLPLFLLRDHVSCDQSTQSSSLRSLLLPSKDGAKLFSLTSTPLLPPVEEADRGMLLDEIRTGIVLRKVASEPAEIKRPSSILHDIFARKIRPAVAEMDDDSNNSNEDTEEW